MFNRVQNHKDTHELWTKLCALHKGSKSECEERLYLDIHKLNTFEMLPKENANEMYSRLNVIVEELNGLGLNKMSPTDVARINSHEMYMHINPQDSCWHFLASQLKIDYKSIISNGTRNVGCWYTITIVTSER